MDTAADDYEKRYMAADGALATDQHHIVRAVRWSTVVFAVILIVIGSATAWVVIQNPKARIIPIVLGGDHSITFPAATAVVSAS